MNEDCTFDEWFDDFMKALDKTPYLGPVDKYTLEDGYENGATPEYAAREFYENSL